MTDMARKRPRSPSTLFTPCPATLRSPRHQHVSTCSFSATIAAPQYRLRTKVPLLPSAATVSADHLMMSLPFRLKHDVSKLRSGLRPSTFFYSCRVLGPHTLHRNNSHVGTYALDDSRSGVPPNDFEFDEGDNDDCNATEGKPSSPFSSSREDWKSSSNTTPANAFSHDQPDPPDPTPGEPTTPPSSSGTYSYSYRRSQTSRGPSASAAEKPKEQSTGRVDLGDTKDLFRHMRTEFESVEVETPVEEDWEKRNAEVIHDDTMNNTQDVSQKRRSSAVYKTPQKRRDMPTRTSSSSIMRWFMRIPVYILSEVIIPVVDVGSLLWYDVKLNLLERIDNTDGNTFFAEDTGDDDVDHKVHDETTSVDRDDWRDTESDLSIEERQLLEVQRAAQNAVNGLGQTVKNLMRPFL